ncbi:Crp/Fnr family transcriptional regulator [Ruminococcaceae bacterium OttesenSCG-928-L11]|nr:Crp/Fnr family transcriptional regulator [Ruminococcaceae bacterium OttesenSCG-928-L11]
MNALSDKLRDTPIFTGLSQDQIEQLLPCLDAGIREYAPNEYVYRKGCPMDSLCLVLEGKLLICRQAADGDTSECAETNCICGEIDTLSSGGICTCDVMAVERTRVLFLSRDFFLSVCRKGCGSHAEHQQVVRNLLQQLSDKAQFLNRKVAYLTASDLKTKVAMYLCDLYEATGSPEFTMPLNRDRLAAFFSVARPSLSRELVNLKTQGLIDFHRSSVTLLDVDGLYQIARFRDEEGESRAQG